MSTAASPWWYVARASGIVAWGLLALSVLWGLALSTKVLGRRPRPNWLLDLHRFLGGLGVVFVGVHLLGLVLDTWIHIGPTEILVPLTSSWKPVAVTWGVVAFYLLVAVEVTSLLRRRLPKRWWKGIHFSSYALYLVATVHLLTAGTDRSSPLLMGAVVATTAAVIGLTAVRVASASSRSGVASTRPPRVPPRPVPVVAGGRPHQGPPLPTSWTTPTAPPTSPPVYAPPRPPAPAAPERSHTPW